MGLGAHEKAGRTALRLIRWPLGVAATAYFGYHLLEQWPRMAVLPWDPGWMALACVALAVALLGQVWAWRWNLSRLGAQVGYHALFRVYYIANLARYVPGKIWSLAGMIAGGRRLGVAAELLSVSIVVGLVSSLLSGVIVGLVAALIDGQTRVFSPWYLAVPALALAGLWPPLFRRWMRWLLHLARRRAAVPLLTGRLLFRSTLHYGLVWCALAAAIGCVGRAFAAGSFGLYFSVFPLAYLAGYVALLAPGGFGVRESSLVLLAGGGPVAVAVSLVQRVLLSAFELGLFCYSLWSWRHD